ncbi:hypothetical protein D9758_001710 [Tetrapyrgos nigripes]|uniref:DNA-directed RNA polymerase III subunit RPC3 n=1 Tax=Tetrapyrgos nigripes TaxID=182062 RepID=A0A8H5GXR0_9AGAR|nr:hypothetical protein D9758_001710 [Tetrapyrgos nigripes]
MDALCQKIIYNHFGPHSATVANALLQKGRLSFVQLLKYTKLKPKTLRSCLLVLIQHNILWHTTEDTVEILEFNVDECLIRLRFGTFVYTADEQFGSQASEIIQLVLDHGKLTPPQILQQLVPSSSSSSKTKSVYAQALHRLDKLIQYETEEKAKISGFPTARQLREAKETAWARLKREEEEAEKSGLKPRPSKSKPKAKTKASMKRKIIDNDEDKDDESDTIVDDTIHFRVNPDKFAVHLRNELIVKAARERFNEGAALVVRAALKLTENGQIDVREAKSEPISISNIALHLSSAEDLEILHSGLIYSSSSSSSKKSLPSSTTCIKDYIGMLSCADNPTPQGRAQAFLSFTRSSSGASSSAGGGKIQIDFDIIAKRLRRKLLETVTKEKFGAEGLRIVRLLLDGGKMDEKQITSQTLMPPPTVRPLLTSLSSTPLQLISTYPVPKTTDRNPTRTIYLWYVDLAKAYEGIVEGMIRTLGKIGARREVERGDGRADNSVNEGSNLVKKVLEKRERADVREAEEKREKWFKERQFQKDLGLDVDIGEEEVPPEGLLTDWERQILEEWERKEEKLQILEGRVEEGVFLLRDLGKVFGRVPGGGEEE